jgi:Family of unknown function (DUF5681)
MRVVESSTQESPPAEPSRRGGSKKGQSGDPKVSPRSSQDLAESLSPARDEKVSVTEDGRRRRVTKREMAVKQLVDKSAAADLRAIKMPLDTVEGVESRAAAAPASRPPFTPADDEVIAYLKARIERGIRAAIAAEKTWAAPQSPGSDTA